MVSPALARVNILETIYFDKHIGGGKISNNGIQREMSLNERILVEYESDLYRAVVQRRRIAFDGSPEYRIHYEKYRKTWDEWIDNREGLPRTKANLKQMAEESKKKTVLRNEEKKAKALAKKLKKQEKLLKASQKSEVKKKRGRPPGKKSSDTPISNPKAPPPSLKKPSNKPISNSQAVRKKNSSKSTNELPKNANKNKNSVPPEEPTPKKRGRPPKRPSTSNVEATQPKRRKNKSTSTDDLKTSFNYDLLNYLEVRPKGGKLDKKKNKKSTKNNVTKKVNNSIPQEPKFKKKRGRKPKKKQVDKEPIDIESIIESTKHVRVVLERLDLTAHKHLKISLYNKTGQSIQNEPNVSNTETTQLKIDKTFSREYLPIIFPHILHEKLINDEILINEQNQVLQFPSVKNSIAYVVEKYIHSKESINSKREALETGVTILNYFNCIIFEKIMYPHEKEMSAQNKGMIQFLKNYRENANCSNILVFHQVLKPKKVWSHVCGPTHLLRLFKFIPPNITDLIQSKTKITGITIANFQDFLSFMAANFQSIFKHESYASFYDVTQC